MWVDAKLGFDVRPSKRGNQDEIMFSLYVSC